MSDLIPKIQTDFDKLAHFSHDKWDHNSHYHAYLLQQRSKKQERALEIGCGTGAFSRLLAKKYQNVLALDLSPEMVRLAQVRSTEYPNIKYQQQNILKWDFPVEEFDCVASIATLHHLPQDYLLEKIKASLKPGGVLLVLDLYEGRGNNPLSDVFALILSTTYKLIKNGRIRPTAEEREAWEEHGKTDKYLTLEQVRKFLDEILPGATVKKHLLWRYSLIWQKP